MFNEIGAALYDCQMVFEPPHPNDAALVYRMRMCGAECDMVIGAHIEDRAPSFPTCADFPGARFTYLFSVDGRRYWLVREGEGDSALPAGYAPIPVRSFLSAHANPAAFAAVTGLHLSKWYESHLFCGRCGAHMECSGNERALVCPACETVEYPRIAPAIIVAVTDGDRLLMTRYASGDYHGRALVAGFVEVGETAEKAVAREVFEECGLRIRNVRYFASQPWGLSGSLMLGFSAELDGSPRVELRDGELSWAGWVERGEIVDADDYELGRTMIEAFRNGTLG